MVLTLCNLHWWCFSCYQIGQRPHCTCGVHYLQFAQVVLFMYQLAYAYMTCNHAATACCNLHWWCFSSTNQAFTIVHTYNWACFATWTVWWWLYVAMLCVHACVRACDRCSKCLKLWPPMLKGQVSEPLLYEQQSSDRVFMKLQKRQRTCCINALPTYANVWQVSVAWEVLYSTFDFSSESFSTMAHSQCT